MAVDGLCLSTWVVLLLLSHNEATQALDLALRRLCHRGSATASQEGVGAKTLFQLTIPE